MELSEPWSGSEPISEAVHRNGLTDLWELALVRCDRTAAALLLCSVGAEPAAADQMVAQAFASTSIDGD